MVVLALKECLDLKNYRLVLNCRTGVGKTIMAQAALIMLGKKYPDAEKVFVFANKVLYERDIASH